MYLVTGGTGRLGTQVLGELIAATRPARVRALVRRPDSARALARVAPGVAPVIGEFAAPDSLDDALAGVDKVFLLSPAGPRQVKQETNLVEAAGRAGVRHVVKLSWTGAARDCDVPFGAWHWEIEQALERSGIPYTHVRTATFMQHLIGELLARDVASEGVIRTSARGGRIGLVDTRDVAEVTARVLVEYGHEGQLYEIT